MFRAAEECSFTVTKKRRDLDVIVGQHILLMQIISLWLWTKCIAISLEDEEIRLIFLYLKVGKDLGCKIKL